MYRVPKPGTQMPVATGGQHLYQIHGRMRGMEETAPNSAWQLSIVMNDRPHKLPDWNDPSW